jgi:hypothetical protein
MLLAASPATAANRHDQERAARKACLTGDYTTGIAILSDLFIDTKDPTYIFNQGRCFEQSRKFEDAIARFEEYLRATEGTAKREGRAAAEKHLASCKESLAEERGSSSLAPTPPTPPQPSPTPKPELTPTPKPSPSVSVQAQPTARGRRTLRIAGIITASVGVAALATGVILNLKANSLINDMETIRGDYSASKADRRKTYETISWVGYGVGAACLATGAVLFGIGLKSTGTSPRNVALLPMFGPDQAGALLTGGF